MNKKLIMVFGLLAILLFFVGCETSQEQENVLTETEEPVMPDDSIPVMPPETDTQETELPEVVASVDGVEIRGDEVSSMLSQMQAMGQPVSVEDVINQLALTIVLEEEADDRGVEVYPGMIEDLIRADMEQQGLTEEALAEQGIDLNELIAQQEALISPSDLKIMALIEDEKEVHGIDEVEAEQRLIQLASERLASADFQLFVASETPSVEQEIIFE